MKDYANLFALDPFVMVLGPSDRAVKEATMPTPAELRAAKLLAFEKGEWAPEFHEEPLAEPDSGEDTRDFTPEIIVLRATGHAIRRPSPSTDCVQWITETVLALNKAFGLAEYLHILNSASERLLTIRESSNLYSQALTLYLALADYIMQPMSSDRGSPQMQYAEGLEK